MVITDWSKIHDRDNSWRQQLQGQLIAAYVLDRYLVLFEEAFRNNGVLSFLELGSGNGDLSKKILEARLPCVGKYVVSECFNEGIEWLSSLGLEVLKLDAQKINLPDESFDVVLSFDVMHHVEDPRAMAVEMLRVSRKRLLLTEANGLSIGRKIFELSPGHKAAGEKSFRPSVYLDFFRKVPGYRLTSTRIYPLLFVFKTPSALAPALISFSRFIEKVPLLKWQCATVCLDITFERIR